MTTTQVTPNLLCKNRKRRFFDILEVILGYFLAILFLVLGAASV